MRLLIISEHHDDAERLATLLTALGHDPYLAALDESDSTEVMLRFTVRTLQPSVILLDLPRATTPAVNAVTALWHDANARWVPTVLLAGVGRDDMASWVPLQRAMDHHVCVLPFRQARRALYNLIGVLHGLAPCSCEGDEALDAAPPALADVPLSPHHSHGVR